MPKPIDKFFAQDERLAITCTKHDQRTGQLYFGRYEDLYEHIQDFTLADAVPEQVRSQWDLALNLYLHHWYVYEFATTAEQQAYGALEAALRYRLRAETGKPGIKGNLGTLIQSAIGRKWLNVAEFEFMAPWSRTGTFTDFQMIKTIRDRLAHGHFHLGVGGSFSALKKCHEIIRKLYPQTTSPILGAEDL